MNPARGTPLSPTPSTELHLTTSDIHFSRILVAIDFSDPAEQSLKVAITISQMFGSKLFLVRAVSPLVYNTGNETMPFEFVNAGLDGAKERMARVVSCDPTLQALDPRMVVAYAGAVDLITDVARDESVDLIIAGSHGARGLERLAIGSVAETILRQATCPVLIVGPNCKAETEPFRSIVFASDLESTGLRGAQYAAALAERAHGKLTLLHVMNRKYSSPDLMKDQTEDQVNQELRQLLPQNAEMLCTAKVEAAYGSAPEVIESVAEAEHASLVVVGLRHRAFGDHSPWSTTSHLIRNLKCPVLGVRGHLA
jgi:nucleotide-binding universal stress UspA family protein